MIVIQVVSNTDITCLLQMRYKHSLATMEAYKVQKKLKTSSSWQELIESIVWAHIKLEVYPATQPRALSIIKGHSME